MLTNKQIHTLLLENKDINAFKKFVGFKSRQALEFRLASTEPKNNLDGQYRAFILEQKGIKQGRAYTEKQIESGEHYKGGFGSEGS